jgi:hypothetical protein
MKFRPSKLQPAPAVSAGRLEDRQTAPDRTGSVRGLTRRSFHRIAFTDWGPPSAARPVLSDAVEKVENRRTMKISQMVGFGLSRRCDALWCRYGGPWSFF